jgi:hypothetical protein
MRNTFFAIGAAWAISAAGLALADERGTATGKVTDAAGKPVEQSTVAATRDIVEEASEESFPASDAPSWTQGHSCVHSPPDKDHWRRHQCFSENPQ